ncbi:MAG: glutamate--tRNA ligase [Alphaproteobacteria bacterium]|jgi:glutamyl-tRNA synthetase|nr:glutamate--tRNA ligase [Alphaproteobacteria bacterium]MBT4016435.1 glutamate--tRNA ligase [Alphaproteobacteria bacterium]MBT4965985.1 glutamate--tRNA ligase [Alphaproteobacteria bacterium]MBT5160412.1 glutamate--tRNA ligase [Alphaproteobacteria bacterium]MBT5919242.1 glutamate--tRNA ligase [Alphaproteobacteria bacterium]
MTVITRFAPSPTGFLHIGGARTALFNWLYARHHGGQFRLRIEDTDRARSTPEAMEAIVDGMKWLGLDWDGEIVYQSKQAGRHAEVASQLLAEGNAYYCYCTPEELTEMRETAKAEGRSIMYDGRWRDRDASEAPEGIDPVVRLKAPRQGETLIEDQVQGSVKFRNDQLDDMVLLRGDGSPTYMLSVVVDDHDMGITHIMRGDDHLNNAARQIQLYKAMDWDIPVFGHIPLIHGADGAKLSKRHGALGIDAYRDMGYLPEAIRNHLLRLGWSHGDDEFISTEQAIEWFDVDGLGKSPSRFDFKKLDNVNGHYMRQSDDQTLLDLALPGLTTAASRDLEPVDIERLTSAMPALKERAKSIPELIENALFLTDSRPLTMDDKSATAVAGDAPGLLAEISPLLAALEDWTREAVDACVRQFATDRDIKFGVIAQPLRAALTGRAKTPGIFDVLMILGQDESLARIADISNKPA